ncbi:hypothetical protein L2E82_21899 [Cichorium intybus]|uniref:Uncharacterized protein n=1 Tax=Cichorium intybus TaxID=13427 RepID=A0ACB9DW76_CICIN|nr:hypothetical protein L2E82_21899 [Cichorium intybus]
MSKEKSDVSSMEVDDQISTNPKFSINAASLALGIKTEDDVSHACNLYNLKLGSFPIKENSPPDDVSGAEAIATACKVQSSITFISNLTKDEVPDEEQDLVDKASELIMEKVKISRVQNDTVLKRIVCDNWTLMRLGALIH